MHPDEVTGIIRRIRELVATRYVFPELGIELAELLDHRLADGRYARADHPESLAALVTQDLQSRNADKHLRLRYRPDPIPDLPGEEAILAMHAAQADRTMGGIARIDRLDGNIGLLAIEPVLFRTDLVGAEIGAAMQILARAAALIIDLRQCVGGDPGIVALLCTYLVDEESHLNDMFIRDPDGDHTIQSWTLPYVPGPRFGGTRPVYVLTSVTTFSGGEELAYDLQQLGRATIVGERTGGGAHPRIGLRLHPHLEASIPVGRSIHPVTGTNWEGVGVSPDIAVPADDALTIAHQRARAAVDQGATA